MVCYGVLKALLRDKTLVDANDLRKGLPGLASAVPVEKLWELSRTLRQQNALVSLFNTASAEEILERIRQNELPDLKRRLEDYFDVWGFRSSGELMLSRPTPREDPLPILRLLKHYVSLDTSGPADVSQRQAVARQNATRLVRQQFSPIRRVVFDLTVRAAQASIRLRERARMKQALLYTRLRHVALALADALVHANILDRRDDVLFLTIDEAIAVGESAFDDGHAQIRKRVATRRKEFIANSALQPPDSFTLEENTEWRAENAKPAKVPSAQSNELTGIGACGGRACGQAAVVLDVSEIDRIVPDQILVTRQTDPGWAAVFFLIKGLVIERGGLLSHGAIIAREYGIPAVVGVRDATRLISPGQQLCVDGSAGTVSHDCG